MTAKNELSPSNRREEVAAISHESCSNVHQRINRLFHWLLPLQWVGLVAIALAYTPKTWEGAESSTHLHLWAAVIGGGLATAFPLAMMRWSPCTSLARCVTAAAQLCFSTLLIHLTGGRIEAHFHIFGSLAFIAAYRDWRALVTATVVAAVDHVVRGIWMPASIFGVDTTSYLRIVEHVCYVVFEDVVLFTAMYISLAETQRSAVVQAEANQLAERLEQERAGVEAKVQQAVSSIIEERVLYALDGIRQIAVSIEENARAANQLSTHSDSNGQIAKEGNRKMQDVMSHVRDLASGVNDTRAILETLQRGSQRIGAVTKIIEDVAFQTNLLALNAAVEAARAGDHGAGFAVVADEVRALAGRTSTAVVEIDEMAKGIVSGATQAMQAIEEARERADRSIEYATDASGSLATVEASSQEMVELVAAVAAATEEQSISSKELASTVEAISCYTEG